MGILGTIFILQYPNEWARIVDLYHDARDDVPATRHQANGDTYSSAHICAECRSGFASQKALDQHCRKMHGFRQPHSRRIGDTPICPACKRDFTHRGRLLVHLGDRRRCESCRITVMHLPELPQSELDRLSQIDRLARTEARKSGHTHVLV